MKSAVTKISVVGMLILTGGVGNATNRVAKIIKQASAPSQSSSSISSNGGSSFAQPGSAPSAPLPVVTVIMPATVSSGSQTSAPAQATTPPPPPAQPDPMLDRTKFALRLYQTLLARTPSPTELLGWAQKLPNMQCAEVAGGFLSSQEFSARNHSMSNSDFVAAVYNGLVLVDSMDPTLAGPITRLNNGSETRQQVVDGILQSVIFNLMCKDGGFAGGAGTYAFQTPIETPVSSILTSPETVAVMTADPRMKFVYNLYENLLGRDPAGSELATWRNQIQSTSPTCLATAQAFVYGSEFSAKSAQLAPADFVTALYKGLLSRNPDAGGLQAWVNALNTQGRQQVEAGFLGSAEFSGLCSSTYGF